MFGGFARFSVCALALLFALPVAAQEFVPRVIVEANRETSLGTFREVAVQGVTRQGQVLFTAALESVRDRDDQALFLWVDGRIVRLIGRDDDVPGGEIRRVLAAVLAPRSAADRAFVATVREAGGEERDALYVSAERQLRRIVRRGEALEGGSFLGIREGSLQVNGRGEVIFLGNLDTNGNGTFEPGTDTIALYLYTGGRLRRLAAVGDLLRGGRVTNLALGSRSLNDRGRVAWEAALEAEGGPESVVVVADRTRVRRVLRSGDETPGGRVLGPRGPVVNEPGNVAFVAELDRDGNGRFDAEQDETGAFLFRVENSPPTLTLLRSGRLERGDTLILAIPALDDFNRAVVAAQVDANRDRALDEADREALYLAATSGVAALARGGRRLRFGGDLRGGELRLGDAILNNRSAVAIGGFVDGDESGDFTPGFDEAVILYAAGEELVAVARDRQILGLSAFDRGQILNLRGPNGLTDAGVVVFTADLDRNLDGTIDPDDEGRAILLALPPQR
jgi:hypothetical protein